MEIPSEDSKQSLFCAMAGLPQHRYNTMTPLIFSFHLGLATVCSTENISMNIKNFSFLRVGKQRE